MGKRSPTKNVSTASRMFRDGCGCSQAILATYAPPLGLPRETALQIASGFAGGMRMAGTCGAVTGAFMVLGLRHAGNECSTKAGRAQVNERVIEFSKRFQERNGSTLCRELLGCDISTPEGLKQAQDGNLFKTTCVRLVECAATILEDMAADR